MSEDVQNTIQIEDFDVNDQLGNEQMAWHFIGIEEVKENGLVNVNLNIKVDSI